MTNNTTLTDDVRALADYLDVHPDATKGYVRILADYAINREQFIRSAAALGDGAEVMQQGDTVRAQVTFGQVRLYVDIRTDNLVGPPVVPQVDVTALAAEISAAREEAALT